MIDFGNFFLVPVNYLAVLLSAVSNMVVGFLWYGPLYGKEWRNLVGFNKSNQKNQKEMSTSYTAMFLAALLTAYTFTHFLWYAAPGSLTLFIALKTALWAWLGFIFPISLTKHLFTPDHKPTSLLFIETGYHFVALMLMAVIFYLFK